MRINYLQILSLAAAASVTAMPVMADTVYAKETDTEEVIVEEAALFSAQTNKYSGAFEYNEDGTVTQIQEGIMPSKGNVDALVFMVDFPDVNHDSAHTKEYVDSVFFERKEYNNGNVIWGDATLADFYDASSYGQLQIDGQVYGWYTAEHERDYYARNDLEYPMAENLFWEVIDAFDDAIDYSKYDKDNDGYVDSVYIVYAGTSEGWGSTFWTYVDETISNQEKDGKKIAQYGFINESELNGRAIEHETGHMLGLIDYYDYEKQQFGSSQIFGGSETLMLDNQGDLDMWSKILLGWVQPAKITSDTSFSLRTSNKYGDAAIVYPKQADTNSFFVIEYSAIERVALYGGYKNEDRVRIYRINYTSGNAGGFKYGVTDESVLKTIELVYDSIDNTGGISPYCNPASHVIVENTDGTFTREFTGITIKHDKINEQNVNFTVTYESLDVNKKPSYTMETKFANNKVYIELVFDIEMYGNVETMSIEASGGGQTIPLKLGHNEECEYFLYSADNPLLPDTTYTFTIPEGCLVSYYGATNEKITGSFTTDNYSTAAEYNINLSGLSFRTSGTIALTEDKYGYFTVNNGKLYLNEHTSEGLVNSRELADASTKQFINVHACKLENGEFVIAVISYNEGENKATDLYRLYTDGTCELVKEGLYIDDYFNITAIGNNALIPASHRGAYLLKPDNSFELKEDLSYVSKVLPYKDNIYILWDVGFTDVRIGIVDDEVNIIHKEPPANVRGVINYNGYIAVFGYRQDSSPFIKYYSSDYKLVGEETPNAEYYEVYPCKNGFITTYMYDIPFYNENGSGYFSGWMYSPVVVVSVYNLNFEKQFSYTLDYEGTGCGDSVRSVVQLENGDIVVSTDWCAYDFTDFELKEVPITHRVHEFSADWISDNSNHWHVCTADGCGAVSESTPHTAGDWIVDKNATLQLDGSKHKECTICGYVMATETIPKLIPTTNAVMTDAGLYLLENTRQHILIGVVAAASEPADIEYRWSAKDSSGATKVIKDWTINDEWLDWTPDSFGEYTLTAEARVVANPSATKTVSEVVYFNPFIKDKCQAPYELYAPGQTGYLIGVETYENPDQSYQYEMLILDCTLLAEGKPAWVYTTGKFTVTEGAAGWCVWQPQYGYYWTLFRVYDAEGNMIDQACYPFVNAY